MKGNEGGEPCDDHPVIFELPCSQHTGYGHSRPDLPSGVKSGQPVCHEILYNSAESVDCDGFRSFRTIDGGFTRQVPDRLAQAFWCRVADTPPPTGWRIRRNKPRQRFHGESAGAADDLTRRNSGDIRIKFHQQHILFHGLGERAGGSQYNAKHNEPTAGILRTISGAWHGWQHVGSVVSYGLAYVAASCRLHTNRCSHPPRPLKIARGSRLRELYGPDTLQINKCCRVFADKPRRGLGGAGKYITRGRDEPVFPPPRLATGYTPGK